MFAFGGVCPYLHVVLHNEGLMEVSTSEQKLWTVLSVLTWSADHLGGKGFDSPRLTIELLLAHVLQCNRIDLYMNFDRPLSEEELSRFREMLKRRLAHEPLQYILGETEFMGLKFKVDRRVLIPRPETEVLVEEAVKLSKTVPLRRILDVGVGSGNIAVSLVKHVEMCEVDAIDISQDAIDVARENVRLHRVETNVNLIQLDILQQNVVLRKTHYDLIVSNPPYISRSDFGSLQAEIRNYEPRVATTDGGNGLTFYEALAGAGARHLRPGGWMLLEFGYGQHDFVYSLFKDAGYEDVEIIGDYGKIPRIIKVRQP